MIGLELSGKRSIISDKGEELCTHSIIPYTESIVLITKRENKKHIQYVDRKKDTNKDQKKQKRKKERKKEGRKEAGSHTSRFPVAMTL